MAASALGYRPIPTPEEAAALLKPRFPDQALVALHPAETFGVWQGILRP